MIPSAPKEPSLDSGRSVHVRAPADSSSLWAPTGLEHLPGILSQSGEDEGDIVKCESVPGKTGSLSVSSYSSHSMMAIHYVPLGPYSSHSMMAIHYVPLRGP